ncbi:Neurobeachin-like protein 2 [Acipenser ruthenus]|uniref:Neurobeachin-like protein 2 n=1 Tax=Acipenser ruthenus TaxID=7906 RepID=A0A662YUW3_ACIRT|nr:Neurobeachin-like protein 2 [Acipenser ruthenus]
MELPSLTQLEKDLVYLQQWLEVFVTSFEKIIDVNSLDPRRPEESASEIPLLPRDLLQVLNSQLAHSTQRLSSKQQDEDEEKEKEKEKEKESGVGQALLLIKFLIIICRNLENIEANQTPGFIYETMRLLSFCITELKSIAGENGPLESVVLYGVHLCECVFDPYQTWRRQLTGEVVSVQERSKYKFSPVSLPEEFTAFFHESFKDSENLPEILRVRLVHLYGAIISGCKSNALLAIVPSSVGDLMGVLSSCCCTGNQEMKDPRLLQLTLKCLTAMIHLLHASNLDQRQVDIRTVLDSYFRVLNSDRLGARAGAAAEAGAGEGEARDWEDRLITLRTSMLSAIPEMLNCADRPVLQAIFLNNNCFEHILRLIQNSKVFERGSDSITVHALRVLTAIMTSSPSAKAVEGDHTQVPAVRINNEQPLLLLVQWIPKLTSRDLQVLLSDWLGRACGGTLQDRTTAVQAGLVSALLDVLSDHHCLDRKCADQLIGLLQSLGALSLPPGELKRLLLLLRPESEAPGATHPYCDRMVQALSAMAGHEGVDSALQYFDLTPSMAGIMVPAIQRWPGYGFSFHAWLCLNMQRPQGLAPQRRLGKGPRRKQLYSFFTASGTGIEAFFTAEGMLVVAVCTKKDYMTVALPEVSFSDSAWHSVDIVHIAGRRPFGQNLVNIFVDGLLCKSAQLRVPSLSEAFTSCCIGSAGHRTTTTTTPTTTTPTLPSSSHPLDFSFPSHAPPLSRSQSFPASFSGPPTRDCLVHTIPAGNQDAEWGTPSSLGGMLGTAFVCHEALQPAQVKALHSAGPNSVTPFKPDGEMLDLNSKLLLCYTPKACKNHICLDLSPNHQYDGRLTGHKVVNWDVKDVINCVGGMGVLLPMLEQVGCKVEESETPQETTDLVGPELTSSRNTPSMLLPLGKSSEGRLERNSVAAFLLMVKNFLRHHPVNQESLVQCQGPAIMGALLQKVPSQLIDMNVLRACQFLIEQTCSEGNNVLLHYLYQHLLFDFRIWSHGDFAVRLGHIQYVSSIIKDNKQRIRRKYGVQYVLDSIRTHYGGEKDGAVPMDDVRTVQTSLFQLVREFLSRAVAPEELQSILSYAAAVQDEQQVCGVLEVIHGLLRGGPTREQLFGLLFDTGHIEVLYSLLLQKKYSDELRERVFKILYKILKFDKVPERSKHRLKLKDIGYQGLISCLNEVPVSMSLIRCLSEQVLVADVNPNYRDLIAVVYLSHRADLTVRLDVCRKLFHLIYSNQDNVRQLARQAGWQDTLTMLYVKESYKSRAASLSSSLNSDTLDLQRQDSSMLENPQETRAKGIGTGGELSDVFLPFGYESPDLNVSEGFSALSLSPGNSSCPQRIKIKSCGNSFDSQDVTSHSSSNTIDIPGAQEEELLYSPFSPFGSSPFELGLELASTGSLATVESGSHTPVSQADTPSPLEAFKPFPGMRVRKSSSLSNVLDESSFQEPHPGDNTSNTSNPQQTPEEELCNLLTNIVFSVTWRGVEGSDDTVWKERGQVFSVLTKLGSSCELVRPPDDIKRSLLEMMLESAFSDIKDSTGAALPGHLQNVVKLLRLLQDFLFAEGHANQALWSEKIFEGVVNLLDKLQAWYYPVNGATDMREMPQIGLRIITGYIQQQNAQVCAMACVKLHSLLQTVMSLRTEEVCFLLGRLGGPLSHSLAAGHADSFTYLVPIVRTLLDQHYEMLQLQHLLPNMPPTNGSATLFEDLQNYCRTVEWQTFIEKHYEDDTFGKSHDLMSNFWNSCFDALMSSSLRREKEKADSRTKFQELIVEPYLKRMRSENLRYANMLKQINSHHSAVLRQWRSLRRLLTCQRGAWAERKEVEVRWKLSSAETYSKMRLKLVPNYSFDSHSVASALRDNMGADHLHSPTESIPLAVAKEAKVSEMEDDQLGDEDLVFLDNQVDEEEQNQKEKLVISEDCELITIVAVIQGRLEVTTHHIYFYDGSTEKEETEEGIGLDFKRPLSQLREVHLRRYNLRRSALELFFIDQAHYFINFKKKVRNKVYSRILGLRPPNLFYFGSRSPQELLKASGLTQKWVFREISNFEYLMQLNTIAGRTYNDLSQYPVFPWILYDYSSDTLDLDNPATFRDLSKPIGVVNSRHAKDVKEKYESFEDSTGTIDKFHYGTHYSNAAGVMHYMIRTEPFTTLHIQLQSGRFDCADRQFHSVHAAWQARVENPVDVKELIPEFFYFPEFLENMNGFDLGSLQMSLDKVHNVVLPKWAESREDFIRKHRKALECEHVSGHLHEWIDLIFGYKQRGPAAVEALNVFYYCTYEGAVDLDAIADETERKALEGIISNFGQTPCQLLRSISDNVSLVQAVVPKNQARSFITQGYPDLLKWVFREISNFEYLMQLNTIAGRTYNDLSQYPVFPWILYDYSSDTLDLDNPATFRDLSKPIGVVNSRHAKDVKEKYESFEDSTGTIDKFHYGTHYSNAAGVMHYMIRTEPFTTLHIQLQSGRFDCADRQFHSVHAAWQARVENPVDVKELIPEFFYFPEFLENMNGFDLGSLQMSLDKVHNVVLPKWAESREDFIRKHRKALVCHPVPDLSVEALLDQLSPEMHCQECEHVSGHLHEWIDLIFGYKQRGPAAVEALNVFYYCTYEGAVDLDAIADETERKALEGIISNFGQTPCQLLRSISDNVSLVQAVVPKNQARSFITQGYPDLLVTVSASGLLGTHSWLPYDKNIANYFSFSKDPTVSNPKTQRFLSGPLSPDVELTSKILVVSHDGKLLFSGGHWDNSLRVTALGKGKVVGQLCRHIDIVTCLALDLCGIYLISGSRDTTCMVWQVQQQGGFACGLAPKPVQVLYGHNDEVTCVAISTELDMAVSGSKDGSLIVHSVRRGQFMRTLQPACERSLPVTISDLVVGLEGHIVTQTILQGRSTVKDKFSLHVYSINGKLLASVVLEEQVSAMCLSQEHVILGTVQGSLCIRDLYSLKLMMSPLALKVPVHSVSITKENSHILVGLGDGKLIVVGAGQPSEVRERGQIRQATHWCDWESAVGVNDRAGGRGVWEYPQAGILPGHA